MQNFVWSQKPWQYKQVFKLMRYTKFGCLSKAQTDVCYLSFSNCAHFACAAHRPGAPVCANVADTAMIRLGPGSEKEARKHVKRVNAHIKMYRSVSTSSALWNIFRHSIHFLKFFQGIFCFKNTLKRILNWNTMVFKDKTNNSKP